MRHPPRADAAVQAVPVDPATYVELLDLYARYGAVLDQADWDAWPEFFVEDCRYILQPRENHERGLPLATQSYESRGMLRDRVYGMRETLFHDPYYQRHVIGVPIVRADPAGGWRCEASYAVFRTKRDEATQVFNVGRYLDHVVRMPQGLRFREKCCVFDSEWIPNSLIYPI